MKKTAKIFFILFTLACILAIMPGCSEGGMMFAGEITEETTVNIKSVTVHAGEKIYNAHNADDITNTKLTGDSSQFDYAEEIDVQAHLPGFGYNQHLTLRHNGETVLEEQAYSAATARVKLVFGENLFEWYLNLPADGENAKKVSFSINHTPPVTLPSVLWIHYGQSVFTLSNLGVKTVVTEVTGTTFADNMTIAATVYYKNGEEKGEKIGDYSTESDAVFTLPKGVRYGDVIVELFYTPDSPEGIVPTVIGLKVQDAIEVLQAHGFNYVIYWADNDMEAGRIYNQYYFNTRQKLGFTETIFASNGPAPQNQEQSSASAPEPVITEETSEPNEDGYYVTRYVDGVLVLIRYYTPEGKLGSIDEYNISGTVAKSTFYDDNENVVVYTVFEYNENGELIKETVYNPDGTLKSETDYNT